MKNIIKILIFISFPAILLSQNCNVKIPLELSTSSGDKFDLIEIGLDFFATDDLDESLGERDWFGFPPGNDLHGFVIYFDSNSGANVSSYLDYREILHDVKFHKRYTLNTRFPSDDTLFINWKEIGECIDSAKIVDAFGVNSANMLESNEIKYNNNSIDIFYIDIWYNKNVTSVEYDNYKNNNLQIFPNPSNDIININMDNVSEITVYNALGNEMLKSRNSNIDISELPKGLYFLKIIDIHGKQYSEKFVKVQN